MKISRHKLTPDFASFDETDKTSGTFKSGLPDTIVIHYSAGGTALSCINTLKDNSVKASAHVVIDTDGSLIQLVPFDKIAWHAGKSSWLDRSDLNNYSIGIEIVNAGRLEKSGNAWYSWFGKMYTEEEVVHAVHRNESEPAWWHRYTEEQISTVCELCKILVNSYNIRFILGHDEISPGRKIDPGPAFPLDKIRDRLLHADRKEVETDRPAIARGFVNTAGLNIRSGPGANHGTIAKPLSRNKDVSILDEKNDWYQVDIKLRGWVSKKFVKRVES